MAKPTTCDCDSASCTHHAAAERCGAAICEDTVLRFSRDTTVRDYRMCEGCWNAVTAQFQSLRGVDW
jgi:hypothetical protein